MGETEEKQSTEQPNEKEELARRMRAAARIIPVAENGPPAWVKFPAGLQVPKGRRVIFMRFASKLTSRPDLGAPLEQEDEGSRKIAGSGGLWRQAICWEMSVGDEKVAAGRSYGDQFRFNQELTKQFIRCIDGAKVDETATNPDLSLDVFWEQLGDRYRRVITEVYRNVHYLGPAEQADFFEHCIALATNVG